MRMLPRGCRGASRSAGLQRRFMPRAGAPSESFAQVVSEELDVDVSTTNVDPAFATLVTLPITTSGGDLLIWFTASGGPNGNVVPEFRLLLDATLLGSCGTVMITGLTSSVAVFRRVTGVAPGAHTVTAEFAKQPGQPAAIILSVRPATLPNREHAHLVVAEEVL